MSKQKLKIISLEIQSPSDIAISGLFPFVLNNLLLSSSLDLIFFSNEFYFYENSTL